MARAPQRENLTAIIQRVPSSVGLVSAVVAALSVFCASVFLFAYVRVFDWRLIWLVDYADVVKVGLVAVAFLSGLVWYIWAVLADAYGVAKPKRGTKTTLNWGNYGVRAVWAGSMLLWLYSEYQSGNARYALVISVFAAILLLFIVVWRSVKLREAPASFNVRDAMLWTFLLVLTVGVLGTAFGYYTRDAWRGFDQQITLEGETIRAGRLVMLTSRHAVIYVDGSTIVVPSGAVKRIESRRQYMFQQWIGK